MALWRIPVHWTVGGDAEIEAPTLEMALHIISEASFPDEDWEAGRTFLKGERK